MMFAEFVSKLQFAKGLYMRLLKFQGAIARRTKTTKPTTMPTVYLNPSVIIEVGELTPSKSTTLEAKTFIRTTDGLYHCVETVDDILRELETL